MSGMRGKSRVPSVPPKLPASFLTSEDALARAWDASPGSTADPGHRVRTSVPMARAHAPATCCLRERRRTSCLRGAASITSCAQVDRCVHRATPCLTPGVRRQSCMSSVRIGWNHLCMTHSEMGTRWAGSSSSGYYAIIDEYVVLHYTILHDLYRGERCGQGGRALFRVAFALCACGSADRNVKTRCRPSALTQMSHVEL